MCVHVSCPHLRLCHGDCPCHQHLLLLLLLLLWGGCGALRPLLLW
jgi:hypothetical protein